MRISVVVPLYNRADKLNELIASVFGQDHDDIELILVDDGSKDDPEVVLQALNPPGNVRLVKKENGGANSARNLGIELATGEVVALLDSDDKFHPNHLSSSLELLLSSNSGTFIYNQVNAIRGGGVSVVKPSRGISVGEDMSEYLVCHKGFVQTSTLLGYKEDFQAVRYDEGLSAGQDTDFAIRAAASGYTFRMKPLITVDWDDEFDPRRISSTPRALERLRWTDNIRPIMSPKAYRGDRGWHCAKALYQTGGLGKLKAIYLYLVALLTFSYGLRLSVEVFLQIFFPKKYYHVLADFFIRLGVK